MYNIRWVIGKHNSIFGKLITDISNNEKVVISLVCIYFKR